MARVFLINVVMMVLPLALYAAVVLVGADDADEVRTWAGFWKRAPVVPLLAAGTVLVVLTLGVFAWYAEEQKVGARPMQPPEKSRYGEGRSQ